LVQRGLEALSFVIERAKLALLDRAIRGDAHGRKC
jgi:hypothetical protein